jgi:mannose-1-phosphate guanylyltransferase
MRCGEAGPVADYGTLGHHKMAETAMILGAGRGTRLGPMGLTVPKVLVDIAGVPLLRRQLDYLSLEGVTRVVVNSHHLAEKVEAFVRSYDGPVELTEIRETTLLGTAGGVRHALEYLGDGPFLVLYGDVVIAESLTGLRAAHAETGALATIAVYETEEVLGKGTVRADPHGRVTGFAEKAAPKALPGAALVNAGVYVIDPAFIAELPAGAELDFGHDVFPDALERGVPFFAYRLARPVIDVGTPEGLEYARWVAARGPDSQRASL